LLPIVRYLTTAFTSTKYDFETFSNVVEVYVRYLRAKVDEPFGQRLIQTVRGVGYALRKSP
jgi:two-component system copper resistance phosphate regulon response regulator CusR